MDWSFYNSLVTDERNWHLRLTYLHDDLEIVTRSFFHERLAVRLCLLIHAYAEEADTALRGAGSTTLMREKDLCGLEPDLSYYVQNVDVMIGKRSLDLTVDPPPDLAIEIDISQPYISKLPIYECIGVREVWICDSESLRVLILDHNGHYAESKCSEVFSRLDISAIMAFISVHEKLDDTAFVREFRRLGAGLMT